MCKKFCLFLILLIFAPGKIKWFLKNLKIYNRSFFNTKIRGCSCTLTILMDDYIFQLTNVGLSPKSKRSTPKTKKWHDKLNLRKKKTPTLEINNRSISSPSLITYPLSSSIDVSKRSVSIPKTPVLVSNKDFDTFPSPNSRLSPNLKQKKSLIKETCSICDELLITRTSKEKIIELECSHSCHEQCLLVSVEIPLVSIFEKFPFCMKCPKNKRCIPKDLEFKDKLISEFLISGTSANVVTDASRLPFNDKGKNVGNNKADIPSFYNLKDIDSPILSAPSNPFDVEDSVTKKSSNNIPLALLRSYFIESLLSRFSNELNGWWVDANCGLLRMVDKLMCSYDGDCYMQSCCYLFSNSLVIVIMENSSKMNNLLGTEFVSFNIFPLNDFHIETVKSSILKLIISHERHIYFREALESNSSKIIEKWISGLLDSDLYFDTETFTSTLPIPSVMNRLDNTTGIATINGKNTVLELASDWQANQNFIIRKSIIDPKIAYRNSIKTTISSILSIKRDKPRDIVIVLQIEYLKLLEKDVVILLNTLKALLSKFPDAKICVVDNSCYVLHVGFLRDKIGTMFLNNINASQQAFKKFTPEWLHKLFFKGQCHDTGIMVVSNTTMEQKFSCILMDYNVFACAGRRRPNELKVKIGFLNVDYSNEVYELIEVESWNDLLEVTCYSFNMNFENDDYLNTYIEDSSISLDASTFRNSRISLANSEIESNHGLQDSTSTPSDIKSLALKPIASTLSATCIESNSHETIHEKVRWSLLMNDIEQALHGVLKTDSATQNKQAETYFYL